MLTWRKGRGECAWGEGRAWWWWWRTGRRRGRVCLKIWWKCKNGAQPSFQMGTRQSGAKNRESQMDFYTNIGKSQMDIIIDSTDQLLSISQHQWSSIGWRHQDTEKQQWNLHHESQIKSNINTWWWKTSIVSFKSNLGPQLADTLFTQLVAEWAV